MKLCNKKLLCLTCTCRWCIHVETEEPHMHSIIHYTRCLHVNRCLNMIVFVWSGPYLSYNLSYLHMVPAKLSVGNFPALFFPLYHVNGRPCSGQRSFTEWKHAVTDEIQHVVRVRCSLVVWIVLVDSYQFANRRHILADFLKCKTIISEILAKLCKQSLNQHCWNIDQTLQRLRWTFLKPTALQRKLHIHGGLKEHCPLINDLWGAFPSVFFFHYFLGAMSGHKRD